jgi:hypothetical protein
MAVSRRNDATAELTSRLLQLLSRQRNLGPDVYPLTLDHLLQLAQDAAAPELLAKCVRSRTFKARVALTKLNKTVSLVALAGDGPLLAADVRVLESALEAATPKKPAAQTIARLASKVAADLRPLFLESVHNRMREQRLPARIGVLENQGAPRLYLRDRPPDEVAATDLACRLVQTLQGLRKRDEYPTRLSRLLELAADKASPQVLKKTLAGETLQKQLLRAVPRHAETPVVLAEDVDRLVDSPLLLEFLLAGASKPAVKAFPLKDLKKTLAEPLRQPFVAAVSWRIERGRLPSTIGWLWIKTPHLFFTKDAHGSFEAKPPSALKQDDAETSFAEQFPAAFEQLDRAAGGRNFVSLVDLRRALPMPRGIFDAELFRLRQVGRFALSAAEGRHGISPEEREAGIPEEGSLLLFVSRIGP